MQLAPCILLVERDVIVRTPLAEYLRECGYRVLEAVTAAEARTLLAAANDITLVLAEGDEGRRASPESLERARTIMLRMATAAIAGEGPGVTPLPLPDRSSGKTEGTAWREVRR